MIRAILLLASLALTGCASPQRAIINPTCPTALTIQSGTYAGFCDRRTNRND